MKSAASRLRRSNTPLISDIFGAMCLSKMAAVICRKLTPRSSYFSSVRHGEIGHHPDQHLVQRQALGPEGGEPFDRQPAEVAELLKLVDAARDVRGAEHRRQGKEFARQRGFDSRIPRAVDFMRFARRGGRRRRISSGSQRPSGASPLSFDLGGRSCRTPSRPLFGLGLAPAGLTPSGESEIGSLRASAAVPRPA